LTETSIYPFASYSDNGLELDYLFFKGGKFLGLFEGKNSGISIGSPLLTL